MTNSPVDNLVLFWSIVGIAILIVWFIVHMINIGKTHDAWHDTYTKRKQKFWEGMTERQRKLHVEMRGASEMEQFATLEARIHELEQQLRNQQDDGK